MPFELDRVARKEATIVSTRLQEFLAKSSSVKKMTKVNGRYAFSVGYSWVKYADLYIVLSIPTKEAPYPVFGVIGEDDQPVIYLPILFDKYDLTDILNRFRIIREQFTHEFIHYLDYVRSGYRDGVHHLDMSDMESYINNPSEFNAFYQTGALELEALFGRHKDAPRSLLVQIFPPTFPKFLQDKSLERHWDSIFIDYMDDRYRRKFIKRVFPLYNWYVGELYGTNHSAN